MPKKSVNHRKDGWSTSYRIELFKDFAELKSLDLSNEQSIVIPLWDLDVLARWYLKQRERAPRKPELTK